MLQCFDYLDLADSQTMSAGKLYAVGADNSCLGEERLSDFVQILSELNEIKRTSYSFNVQTSRWSPPRYLDRSHLA